MVAPTGRRKTGVVRTRGYGALCGLTAAAAALGTAELVSVFTGPQSSPLVAVADNRAPLYSRAVALSTGSSRGGSLASAATKLRDAGELIKAKTQTGYELVDPLLAYWVRAGRQES